MRVRNKGRIAILAAVVFATVLIVLSKGPSESLFRVPTGSAQLASIQQLPEGDFCQWEPGSDNFSMMAALQQESESADSNLFSSLREPSAYAASEVDVETADVMRPPVRLIRDTYPIYSSVAVDPVRDEVVLQDANQFGIKIFNRLDNTPPSVEATQPQRVIAGSKTTMEFNNGLYIDPKNGDIYSVASDTADNMIVFSHDAVGNVAPLRQLKTPHRNFASAIDEEKGEIFITIQYPPQVVVYRKTASGDDKPIRVLAGEHAGLHDAHGLAIDVKRKLMFVGNWGDYSDYKVQGTGKFYPPSISVYPLDANGDTAPIRVIQGSKTQLDWPGALSLDTDRGEIYVANDVGNSVLVFHEESDQGDVAPARVIKGNKTGLSHPAGVSVDMKNKEFWVSNLGNSSATCYSLTANGNSAPIRTIRSAPVGRQGMNLGKTQAVAYDTKREEYLVPN
jgi:hypothetical protein